DATLALDRVPKLLVDDSYLGIGQRVVVTHAREAEEIGWKLRAVRVEDEGSAHSEHSTEKARFEDDIVSRRSLAGFGSGRCREARARPVVPSKDKSRKVHLMGELEEAFQCGSPRIEGCCPRFNVCDIFKTACQRLQQFLLLS